MGLDMRPDRLNPVTPGIPGAIRQPQLGRESVALRSIGRRAFSRPKRRAARALSCQVLSGLLADSMTLYGEYKRFDFLPADEAPFGLQGFIDRQASEQLELMDLIVERVGLLGGVAPVPREVAGLTAISRSPNGVQESAVVLSLLVEAQRVIMARVRSAIAEVAPSGTDESTVSLLRAVLRLHESQVWSLEEQLADVAARCA
jgi:starvation-inducible DNA-binding protein